MSSRDDALPLRHMLDGARKAVGFARGRVRADLDSDELLALGLVRLLEIVGEAATRVSEPTRQRRATIPWAQVIGMRNRLIHGYDVIDMDVLWQTITEDLPPLIKELETTVAAE